jgi:hypothetical protein
MATSDHFTIQVGEIGAWVDLPIGSYIEGFRQARKKEIRMIPLAHGGINVADRKWAPTVLEVIVELFEDTMRVAEDNLQTIITNIEANEGKRIQIYDEETSAAAYVWDYDELNEIEVAHVAYAKGHRINARFFLDLLVKPYLAGTA